MILQNNQINIIGKVFSGFTFSHEVQSEKFYLMQIQVMRLSNAFDLLPVMVSDKLLDVSKSLEGQWLQIIGQIRSYNMHDSQTTKLIISIFANEIYYVKSDNNESNTVILEGYVCKKPTYRQTPLGREISDIILATNRPYGKSDYIPCICWGRNSRIVSNFNVGDFVRVEGRFQSREYLKDNETRTTYEVSIFKIGRE